MPRPENEAKPPDRGRLFSPQSGVIRGPPLQKAKRTRRIGVAGATQAERVCWLILPGVRSCFSFEEGLLHAWMWMWMWISGLVVHPLSGIEWGLNRVGSKHGERWAACSASHHWW